MWQPQFYGPSGDRTTDPLTVAGTDPVVDLFALALLFAPPVLAGEFQPLCPWRGVQRVPTAAPQPVGRVTSTQLRTGFRSAVRAAIGGSSVIGVKVSGGLDSLAVLVHVVAVAEGRPVVALCTDLRDDTGMSSRQVACNLLEALGLDVELVIVDPAEHRAQPRWFAAGPRLDALPEVNAATAELAARRGADVLLSGDGADELLAVPRFAASKLARRCGVRAAATYVVDTAGNGPGWLGELAAPAARLLPPRECARAYWAMNWPEWCDPAAPTVLAEEWREEVTCWVRSWVDQQIAGHAAADRDWAAADAHDAFWPYDPLQSAGVLPEVSPYLDPDFLPIALGLPVTDRYDTALPTRYWRAKAAVVSLLPETYQAVLPRRKQYFTGALADTVRRPFQADLSVAAGLLDPRALRVEHGVGTSMTVRAVEAWLAGALKAGARVPGL